MEPMAKKKTRARQRPRRVFTPEFKAQIVELVQRGERTVPEVVREFELSDSVVRSGSSRPNAMPGSAPTG
jgi:transposase